MRRNRRRFPEDFAFQLTAEEFEALRSQFATLEERGVRRAGSNWSQIATLKTRRGQYRKYRPWAFTEHGALQAANILRSDRAIAMSVYVIRAFIELREKIATNAAILKRLAEIDKTLLEHDTTLREIYHKLLPATGASAGNSAPANRISCRIIGERPQYVVANCDQFRRCGAVPGIADPGWLCPH